MASTSPVSRDQSSASSTAAAIRAAAIMTGASHRGRLASGRAYLPDLSSWSISTIRRGLGA
jgi:hypothetical protein